MHIILTPFFQKYDVYSPIDDIHVLNAYLAAHIVTTTCRFNYMPIFIICTQKTLGEMITFALQT